MQVLCLVATLEDDPQCPVATQVGWDLASSDSSIKVAIKLAQEEP